MKDVVSTFDLTATRGEFGARLSEFESKLPAYLFEKLNTVVRIYLEELSNDHDLDTHASTDGATDDQARFISTHLMRS